MPYAANNKISFDEFEGSIQITEDQYLEALNGMQSGLQVTVEDGFKVALPPPPPPAPPPSNEELAMVAFARRDQALSVAAIRIAPLQDAVDLGEHTEAEVEELKAWKQYRIGLNRIQLQVGFPVEIEWPAEPK